MLSLRAPGPSRQIFTGAMQNSITLLEPTKTLKMFTLFIDHHRHEKSIYSQWRYLVILFTLPIGRKRDQLCEFISFVQ